MTVPNPQEGLAPSTGNHELESFFEYYNTVNRLSCDPCRRGLIKRYLVAKPGVCAQVEGPCETSTANYRDLREIIQTAYSDGRPPSEGHQAEDSMLTMPVQPTHKKQWDVRDTDDWSKFQSWSKTISSTEGVVELEGQPLRSSAWRARLWYAVAGTYTVQDLVKGRDLNRFFDDHEQRLQECLIWPAQYRTGDDVRDSITPRGCGCFEAPSYDELVAMFEGKPWLAGKWLRSSEAVRRRKISAMGYALGSFGPRIKQHVFEATTARGALGGPAIMSLPPFYDQRSEDGEWDRREPLVRVSDYWNSPEVWRRLDGLLKGHARETARSRRAAAKRMREAEDEERFEMHRKACEVLVDDDDGVLGLVSYEADARTFFGN